ncbi:hypothetical protein BD779DRAFT_1673494 [Infundibulicybe gibba]|nr:hypothetical protein BD779DRAFT_1673494 [Infundibulicybe gibba]
MTPPFDFVPRKFAKVAKKPAPPPSRESIHPSVPQKETVNNSDPASRTGQRSEAGDAGHGGGSHSRSVLTDTDYVNLLYLALSDYALWSNPDLRRTIDWNTSPESDEVDEEREFGFLPLSHLQNHSHILSGLQLLGHQNAIAKAIRTCASDLLELRLLVTSDSSWFPNHNTADDPGIYEIRRRTRGPPDPVCGTNPAQHRSIHGIANFMLKLLASSPSSSVPYSRLQNITLPPHHLDKPNDPPLCKGFALLTFSDMEDLTYLADAWPWHRKYEHPEESPPHISEAMKFGFRVLPKAEWDKLKAEYLVYRSRLVEEINAQRTPNRSSVVPVTPGTWLKMHPTTYPRIHGRTLAYWSFAPAT